MKETMTFLTFLAIGFYEAVLLTGAIRLLRNGHPNRIQKVFCMMLFYNFIVSAPYFVSLFKFPSQTALLVVLNTFNTGLLCFLPLSAYALMQTRLNLRHYLICFFPMLPEVVSWFCLRTTDNMVYSIIDILTLLYLLGAYAFKLYQLRKWDVEIKNLYSNISHKQTLWYRHTGWVLIANFLLWIPLYFFYEYIWIWFLHIMTSSVLFFIITEYALLQEVVELKPIEEVPVNENPAWVDNLKMLMEEQRIYCQQDLELTDLARLVGCNRTYLSRYINQELNSNFYEYINDYRIKDACHLLSTTDKTIETIALECGFKNRTTFGRNFMQKIGMSPSLYRKKHQ